MPTCGNRHNEVPRKKFDLSEGPEVKLMKTSRKPKKTNPMSQPIMDLHWFVFFGFGFVKWVGCQNRRALCRQHWRNWLCLMLARSPDPLSVNLYVYLYIYIYRYQKKFSLKASELWTNVQGQSSHHVINWSPSCHHHAMMWSWCQPRSEQGQFMCGSSRGEYNRSGTCEFMGEKHSRVWNPCFFRVTRLPGSPKEGLCSAVQGSMPTKMCTGR